MGISRRLTLIGGAALAGMAAGPAPTAAWSFEFPSIDEGVLRLAAFQGKVLLVVNTASFCGFTPQYRQLEALHRRLSPQGFAVIGVPSQDFGQESGSNGEVKAFCEATFGVDFPHGGSRPRARRRCGAVLSLGARAAAVGAGLELQQGADRAGRRHCRDLRFE